MVDIQVGLSTLLELDDRPGELPGWGPVISDIARQVVDEQTESEWRYTVRDENGTVIGNGITRRRPSTGLKRQLQAKAPVCVFPGCRIPSLDCDLDHNQPWSEDGPTSEDNLAPLCRHHHVIRHHGWTIHQTQPGSYQLQPGTYEWVSPLGHKYSRRPEPP